MEEVAKNEESAKCLKEFLSCGQITLPVATMIYYENGHAFLCHEKKGSSDANNDVVISSPDATMQLSVPLLDDTFLSFALSEWPVLQLVCKQLYFKCHPTALEGKPEVLAIAYTKTSARVFKMPKGPANE